jgi:hypothetical protein
MKEPIDIVRDPNHLYCIHGYPDRGYETGITGSGSQVLLVHQFPSVIAVYFDRNGNLFDVQIRTLSPLTQAVAKNYGFRALFGDDVGTEELSAWLRSLQFVDAVIRVKRFFLPEYHIGIVDFPACFRETLQDPLGDPDDALQEDHLRIAQQELIRWSQEGVFELWLNPGMDLWIDKTGEIESS